jgi:multidrug efflux pump subunit AcrB
MIRVALRNPHLIVVLALAVLVVGVASYEKIPADLLPIFKTPAVQIVTFYPGMPPEVMERDIMSRMQRWTGQSVGIEHQEGKAMLGVCIVKDFFREDISMDTAMSQVTSYAMSDLFYLPPGTIPPMVMPFDPTASVPLCLVAISSPTMSEKELYDVAYFELRNRLQSIQGVIAPAVYGGKLRRIMAYVDRDKLEARGLSIMNVVQALRHHNVLIPAGNAAMGTIDYQIFTNAIPDRVEDLNFIPIKVVNGSPVLLRDVGEVRDAAQIQTNIVRTNGRREVYIPIYRQPGANTIEIVDALKAELDQILRRLREFDPRAKDLVLSVVMDQSVGVRQSIQGLQIAGGLGALLAGAVVLIFLRSLRSTLIIVLAIPLSILAAIIGLFYTGDTVNAMTLGGLALAVGILVDQSIVVLENVVRHARMGKPPFQAALEGTQEVALPILVSTITFIVVFYPVVFLSGLARFLFTPLAVSATFAIIASYLMSITLAPAYCARFLRVGAVAEAARGAETSAGRIAGPAALYGRLLSGVLRVRHLVVLAALVGFGLSVPLLLTTGQELFPPVDAKQFTLFVRMPTGTRLEVTEEAIQAVEQELAKLIGQPDPNFALGDEHIPESNMQIMISNIGVLMDWPAAYTPNTGPMDAFVLVQLKGKRGKPDTFAYVQQLREQLPAMFPGVEFSFDTGGMLTAALNMGEPAPIHFQVAGSNLETSLQIAQTLQREAHEVPGATDVRISQRLDYPIIHVDMDKTLAQLQGVTTADVMQNLVSATNSSINFDPAFWIDPKNGNHYFIGAQYREEDINSLDTLRDVPITGFGSVRPALLRNVAEFRRTTGPAVVNHVNITRVIDVYCNVLPGYDVGSVVHGIERRLQQNSKLALAADRGPRGDFFKVEGAAYKGKGYTIQMAGEVRSMRESFRQFAAGLVIAAILVYLAMVAQFRSFLDPFVILLTVPLGFIGVATMLFLTRTPLSIQVFMGIIMMVGIVVEYSIILIDFANSRVRAGMPIRDAVIEAAQVRLRPILMTSITTWLALVPMAVGFGGGEANVPLARTIIGGVLGATALTLLIVPCLYVMLKRPPRAGDDEAELAVAGAEQIGSQASRGAKTGPGAVKERRIE